MTRITIEVFGQLYECRNALIAVVANIACPHCHAVPLHLKARDATTQGAITTAVGIAQCCGKSAGQLVVTTRKDAR